MDHIGNGADTVQGIEAVQRLGGIGHTDGDPVTRADAHGGQTPGRGIDALQKGGIGSLPALKNVGGAVRIFESGIADHGVHGLVGVGKACGGAAVKGGPRGGRGKTHKDSTFLQFKLHLQNNN